MLTPDHRARKTVHVRSYLRCRYEKWETVVSHFRSLPRR